MRSIWIWRLKHVTREMWLGFFLCHLLKLHLHLLFMSHGRCDLSLYIGTPYIYIYTFLLCSTKNYSKRNYKKNTNKKNFKCCGPWPFLLLMASLFACWDDPSSIASLVIFMYFLFTSIVSLDDWIQHEYLKICFLKKNS